MRKIERELRREFAGATVESTNGGHIRLRLENGETVITASTPSDWRTMRNLRAEVKRAMATQQTPTIGEGR